MVRKAKAKAIVVVVLALAAGCGVIEVGDPQFSPDDPRVGQYRGSFDGCLNLVGDASLRVDERGIAFFEADINNSIGTESVYRVLSGSSPQIKFTEARKDLAADLLYDVDATLSADGQLITGTFTATWAHYSPEAPPPANPLHCQFALRRAWSDPRAVDPHAAEFACTSTVAAMDLPHSGTADVDATSPAAPVPSCFTGPVYAMRFRPPATGLYAIQAGDTARISGEDWTRPTAVFSSCTGRELGCFVSPDGLRGGGGVSLQLTRFEDVLLVSAGAQSVDFDVTFN
jgi:hypothetical protein